MADISELQRQHLDLNRVTPINCNRLVTFINHFLVSIVEQLNELTALTDSRLIKLNNKINICHSNLVILEMKLNSISGLSLSDNNASPIVTQTTQSSQSTQSTQQLQYNTNNNANNNTDNNDSLNDSLPTDTNESETKPIEQSEAIEEIEEKEEKEETEDPRMAKYRKMLHLGIPLGAVRQKMMTEGFDPNLLQ